MCALKNISFIYSETQHFHAGRFFFLFLFISSSILTRVEARLKELGTPKALMNLHEGIWAAKTANSLFEICILKIIWCGDIQFELKFNGISEVAVRSWPWTRSTVLSHSHKPHDQIRAVLNDNNAMLLLFLYFFISVYRILFATAIRLCRNCDSGVVLEISFL